MEPPGGAEGGSREVGCQWDGSGEATRKEVGCQSDGMETRDAGVQVDLLGQNLSWRHSGSPAMLLQCLSVRGDGSDGGALLQHCSPNRTRTRIIRPAVKLSDEPTDTRTRTRRRAALRGSNSVRTNGRQNRQRCPSPDLQEEEEEEEEEEPVQDAADPTWTPRGDATGPRPLAPSEPVLGVASERGGLRAVKLEADSTVCDVCGKVMKSKSSLARHSFIHTGKKPFACHLCDLRFNRRDNLQHHLSHLHPNGVPRREKRPLAPAWLCAVCGKTFSCRSRLKTHEVIHSGEKPFRCERCPKAYMRINDLEHHRKAVHAAGAAAPQRPASLLCDLCGKEFKCRSQLAVHFQTHTGERPHLCDICGRKFARQYQLKRHKILLHPNHLDAEDGPPPGDGFTCGVCGKRLKSEVQLAAHARVHLADKPHRCSVCQRGFHHAASLKQHHLCVHLRTKAGESSRSSGRRRSGGMFSSFPCPVCGKAFRFRSLLASHALIHSDVRPFACDFCSRSFRRLSHLKRHRDVVHADGARPPQSFVCHICGKDKKCRSQLARHVIIHTGERPFTCELCPARFNRRGNLQQHQRRMHGLGKPAEAPPILFEDEAVGYRQQEGEESPHGEEGEESPHREEGEESQHGEEGEESPHGEEGGESPHGEAASGVEHMELS
ncbi:zinc finger protein 708-like [Cyprinodon tularosa]|uniref:zinc finger protein 708-like n=1 Tax=Cyprinodon tularosa TaxID=77115 RepID=UPI0018E21B5A|nr:zinc finger protein 708-like [Cyprinodon tularosa]XP_038141802.1 zinc finger protein 708-like [Cyprinodon tularosa]